MKIYVVILFHIFFSVKVSAQEVVQRDFYVHDENYVRYIGAENQGGACVVRLSNGRDKGAITFLTYRSEVIPFPIEIIYGHELGTGATHGARKGDPFEVRVDGDLLATGTLKAGVAPYEGNTEDWQGALLDALA